MKPDKQNGGNKRSMMGIAFIIMWALAITVLVNYLTSMAGQGSSEEISYGQFRTLVEEDKVAAVVMSSTKYTIYLKEDLPQSGQDEASVPSASPTASQTEQLPPALQEAIGQQQDAGESSQE